MKIIMALAMYSKDLRALHRDNILIPHERSFRAMGTDVDVTILTADSDAVEALAMHSDIERSIADFEHRFSRFLPQSELSQLNNADGEPFRSSDEMIALLKVAQQWHATTNGVFDPTVITALETFGYEKNLDFDKGFVAESEAVDIAAHQIRFKDRVLFSRLEIDEVTKIVRVPRGLRLDLGGIGKGYIVDQVAREVARVFDNFWISAGGDIYLAGRNTDDSPWKIDVQDPFCLEKSIGYIKMEPAKQCGVATSGVMRRRGKRGEFSWHHIINPATGLSADSDIVAVTVCAPTVTAADVLAKSALILGKTEGMALIDRQSEAGCRHTTTAPLTEFAGCVMIDSARRVYVSRRMKDNFIFY